ncbi:hypothetical protein HYU20_04095 [Candidatus Woesearchaeota archaeon]|nr:hypothetical protein [Candidatus Woesearchaeota archaeon]
MYDWIFWISVAVVFVWMVLKAVGIIQPPVWQELLPYAGTFAAVVAYFQKTGRYLEKIDHIGLDLHQFKAEMSEFRKEVVGELREHDKRLIRIEAKLS